MKLASGEWDFIRMSLAIGKWELVRVSVVSGRLSQSVLSLGSFVVTGLGHTGGCLLRYGLLFSETWAAIC